ncbi:MAG: AAA family ATPase [Verrucomicrobia bacterium]|nr:AAA family ATPase [Verrucomicrobiota bacterium]
MQERRELERFLKSWTGQEIRGVCQQAAADMLPRYLEDLCTQRDRGFTRPQGMAEYWKSPYWFLDDPVATVLEMMDLRAKEVSQRLAMTAVANKVFDALAYALEERVMVRIEGDSRFGKTESVGAWANMRPGVARIVKVPSSNSITDLLRRVADALGIAYSFGTRSEVLRQRIAYVLRHSSIFLILDESAFLLPQNYSKTTAPERLNWVRTEIVDQGLPLALIHTPQTFLPDADRFVKKTAFAMQQFFGRIYRTVRLPDELPRADLIAVARIHFPEMGDDYLELIADLAEIPENYLQTVEAVAKLARYIARREGHRRITVSDIEAARDEIIPRCAVSTSESVPDKRRQPAPKKSRIIRAAEPVVKGSFTAAARAVQPGQLPQILGDRLVSDNRSLRSAGSGRVVADLESAIA